MKSSLLPGPYYQGHDPTSLSTITNNNNGIVIFTFLEYRFQTKAQKARRRIEKVTTPVNNRHTRR